MRISQHTDLALRILLLCRVDESVSRAWLAGVLGASPSSVNKAVAQLSRAAFISTVSGPNGGVVLARASQQIALGAVVREMEPMALVACMRHEPCAVQVGCTLPSVLDAAIERFLQSLDAVSLADVQVAEVLVQVRERA